MNTKSNNSLDDTVLACWEQSDPHGQESLWVKPTGFCYLTRVGASLSGLCGKGNFSSAICHRAGITHQVAADWIHQFARGGITIYPRLSFYSPLRVAGVTPSPDKKGDPMMQTPINTSPYATVLACWRKSDPHGTESLWLTQDGGCYLMREGASLSGLCGTETLSANSSRRTSITHQTAAEWIQQFVADRHDRATLETTPVFTHKEGELP